MELREPDADDTERMREVARSAMTASYALTPQQIDAILDAEFGDERLGRLGDGDTVGLVAENGVEGANTIAGLVVGGIDDEAGEIRWLFVDPEHRGYGIGTKLFEAAVETLRDRGAEAVRANTLEANADGADFFEQFGYVRTDERPVEIGDESLVEFVYVEEAARGEKSDSAKTDAGEVEFPDAEVRDGVVTATTDDGQRVYLDTDDGQSGDEDEFFPTYVDEDLTEQFGFYCANCGSLDVQVDSMDRLNCEECGNSHSSRTSEAHDAGYL